jgi:hypothetical protein
MHFDSQCRQGMGDAAPRTWVELVVKYIRDPLNPILTHDYNLCILAITESTTKSIDSHKLNSDSPGPGPSSDVGEKGFD